MRLPVWQNFLLQIVVQAVFWSLVFTGLSYGGTSGMMIGGALGFVAFVLVAFVPGFFARLEALQK